MTSRLIRSIDELPKWFKLAGYKTPASLSISQWYFQLSARILLWNFVRWGDHLRSDTSLENASNSPNAVKAKRSRENCAWLLEILRQSPLVNENDPALLERFGSSFSPESNVGISKLSLADIGAKFTGIQGSTKHHLVEYLFGKKNSNGELPDALDGFEVREEYDELILKVRLNSPEKLLLDNFAHLIRSEKNKLGRHDEDPRYRRPDLASWNRLGILPFMDLKIWEIQEDLNITNRVIADAVFPEGEGGEEAVRKTTEKIVEQIFEGPMLEILADLYLAEKISQ